jgi:cytidylate kinase
MATVTIAATYGAGGSVVGREVARRLGLHFIDRAIPAALAERLPAAAGEGAELPPDERERGGVVGQFLAQAALTGSIFGYAMPGDPDPEGEVARGEVILRQTADGDGAVILGRGGVFVLAGRADVLHVRLDGAVEARVAQAVRLEGIDAAAAAVRLRTVDRARAEYLRTFYPGKRWDDPAHYHLMADSTSLSLDACTNLVVAAAHDLLGVEPRA